MSGLPTNGRIWKETAARHGDLCHKRLEEYLQNNSVNCTKIMEIHSQLHDVAFQVQVGQMRHEKWVSVASCWHDRWAKTRDLRPSTAKAWTGSRIWAHNSCECRTSGHSLKHFQSQCAKPECQGAIPIKQQARQKNGNIAKKCQTVRVEKPHPASGILQLGPRQASLQWLLLDVSCKSGWKTLCRMHPTEKISENWSLFGSHPYRHFTGWQPLNALYGKKSQETPVPATTQRKENLTNPICCNA